MLTAACEDPLAGVADLADVGIGGLQELDVDEVADAGILAPGRIARMTGRSASVVDPAASSG